MQGAASKPSRATRLQDQTRVWPGMRGAALMQILCLQSIARLQNQGAGDQRELLIQDPQMTWDAGRCSVTELARGLRGVPGLPLGLHSFASSPASPVT